MFKIINIYYLSQTLSKNNILQKLDKDLWNYIENIIIMEHKNKSVKIIQNYYKKYLYNNFIPNLIEYCNKIYHNHYMISEIYLKFLNRFDNLIIKSKLKKTECFKTLIKCNCCNYHKFINKQFKFLGFNNSLNMVIKNQINIFDINYIKCNCYCNIAATIYCERCFKD